MLRPWSFAFALLAACSSSKGAATGDAPTPGSDAAAAIDAPRPADAAPPVTCTQNCEQAASDNMDAALGDPVALAAFMTAMPKGGDLHNHLSGAVYAETALGWSRDDGWCINSSSYTATASCSASTQPTPAPGVPFFDSIVEAWSMQNYTGTNGHDHFFSVFGKFGTLVGDHRDDTLGDIVTRAAGENQLYIETMFNLAKNVGNLPSGTITAANLEATYDAVLANASFPTALANDINTVNNAYASYRTALQCDSQFAPPGCDVEVRFIAQIARTGSNANIFGQLIGAFEMAKQTNKIVAANLSSPEDDTASLTNYELHMAMLDFLHTKYAGVSPLHVTLHAGELVPQSLPSGHTNDNTFHVHDAVITAHAERIGHGVDIASETDYQTLLQTMHDQNVLVEVCLSSNTQILGVSGAAHPLGDVHGGGCAGRARDGRPGRVAQLARRRDGARGDRPEADVPAAEAPRAHEPRARVRARRVAVDRHHGACDGRRLRDYFARCNAGGGVRRVPRSEREGHAAVEAGVALPGVRVASVTIWRIFAATARGERARLPTLPRPPPSPPSAISAPEISPSLTASAGLTICHSGSAISSGRTSSGPRGRRAGRTCCSGSSPPAATAPRARPGSPSNRSRSDRRTAR